MTAHDTWVKPTTEQVITALDNARELIRAGWVQRRAHAVIGGQPCYCAIGAVAVSCGTLRLSHPVIWGDHIGIMGEVVPGVWLRDAVTAVLMQALPPRFGTIAAYNDQPDRTQGEMVGLFLVAREIAKGVAS